MDANGCLHDNESQHSFKEFHNLNPDRDMTSASPAKALKKLSSSKQRVSAEASKTNATSRAKNHSLVAPKQALEKQPHNTEHNLQSASKEATYEVKLLEFWICKNLACKATLSAMDSFCRRCSCCICHRFDDNKDPSLWLVCSSEDNDNDKDFCGSSCHIECALNCQRVGCIDLGHVLLDGSYCCTSCGKVSGILGSWKRQLLIARDARRVDILCYRIYLSYRLLEGTSHLKELHSVIENAKLMLETEVGPVNGLSAKMARGIVSRLSVGSDVQKLCSDAIQCANDWLSSGSSVEHRDSLPAACQFKFEDVTSCSIVVTLRETSSVTNVVTGYKLWYWKNGEENCDRRKPVTLPKDHRKLLVYGLEPCTEYSFVVISLTKDGHHGHSESKCFTGSLELLNHHTKPRAVPQERRERRATSTGFRIRDIGTFLRHAWAEEGCFDESDCDMGEGISGDQREQTRDTGSKYAAPGVSHHLEMNTFSVPDLNVDVTPAEYSSDENNIFSSKNGIARSTGSEVMELPTVESQSEQNAEHIAICRSGQTDEDYEYCVQTIRGLERAGHIEKDFRMKFLTWFSLRSTVKESRVVMTFIKTLINDPGNLAGQLVDSFLEKVNCKKQRSCSYC